MVTIRHSDQQGSKSPQNPCQVRPTEIIVNISAPRKCIWVRTTVSTVWSAASVSESELQATQKDCLMCCPSNKVIKSYTKVFDSSEGYTKTSYAALYKQWNRPTSKRFIKLLTPYREQRRTTRIVVAYPRPAFSTIKRANHALSVLMKKSMFLKATRHAEIWKLETPRSTVVEALGWRSGRASQHPAVQSPVHISLKNAPIILPVRRSLLALVGRKQTVVRHQPFLKKPLGSRLWLPRTGVQHSPDSSTIELPSNLGESGAYPPDRALSDSPRQCPLPLACQYLSKGTKLELRKGAHLENTILNQP